MIKIANTNMSRAGKRGRGRASRKDLERAAMDIMTCRNDSFDECICTVEEMTTEELYQYLVAVDEDREEDAEEIAQTVRTRWES